MVRPEIVRRKLSHLDGYLDELERYRDVDLETYLAAGGPRRAVERLIQLIVETAADINVHVATELEGRPPSDYRASFHAAARIGLIPPALAERLAPSAGLRNALVHEYATIDDARVHASIPLVLDGFREYARSVVAWVDRQGSTS
ncbi:MAG TPA: DUF86 domain-containing protein [Actinomycetota bacterium]|nr:DUF86 domain-containing protein [Actinomycetota bacterium]